jgi:CHAP domain
MNIQEFVSKWENKGIDFKNGLDFQCYNAAVQYMWEAGWLESGKYPYCGRTQGVRDFIEDFDNIPMFKENGIIKINNSSDPNHIPQSGDVVIYGWSIYGHVGIVIEADVNGMQVFEQNGASGTGVGYDNFCHIYNRDYNGVIGWLRKGISQPQEISKLQAAETPKQRDLNSELSPCSYFYPERIKVIQNAYNINDKDYLIFELKGAGELASNLTKENMTLSQKIASVEKLEQELANKANQEVLVHNVPELVKEEPKTTVIEPVVKSKTIFESKKAIMSIAATLITVIVTFLNKKLDLDLNVTEILAVVSPLLLGVVVQGSTEIIK